MKRLLIFLFLTNCAQSQLPSVCEEMSYCHTFEKTEFVKSKLSPCSPVEAALQTAKIQNVSAIFGYQSCLQSKNAACQQQKLIVEKTARKEARLNQELSQCIHKNLEQMGDHHKPSKHPGA